MQPWKIKSSRYLLKKWWMNIREDHVLLPNGGELPEFHVLEYPDWTCVLCLTKEGRLVMVEQYRHGVRRLSLELPGGAVEPGEEPIEAARRELLEETGYASEHWSSLGRCAPEPSKHTNYAYFFVAEDAMRVADPDLDDSEYLRVMEVDTGELPGLIEAERIIHGTHLTAIYKAIGEGILKV